MKGVLIFVAWTLMMGSVKEVQVGKSSISCVCGYCELNDRQIKVSGNLTCSYPEKSNQHRCIQNYMKYEPLNTKICSHRTAVFSCQFGIKPLETHNRYSVMAYRWTTSGHICSLWNTHLIDQMKWSFKIKAHVQNALSTMLFPYRL